MSEPTCPDCKIGMKFEGKDTFSGTEIREYRCPKCRKTTEVRGGKALWQILEDDREESEKNKKP